jgi:hypothetical protein
VIGGKADNPITRMWLDSEAAIRASDDRQAELVSSNALRWLSQLRGRCRASPVAARRDRLDRPADIAAVAATALTEPRHERAAYALSGPEPLTPGQQVAIVADVLERPLHYQPLSNQTARARMAADTRRHSSTHSSASTPITNSTTRPCSTPSSGSPAARPVHSPTGHERTRRRSGKRRHLQSQISPSMDAIQG